MATASQSPDGSVTVSQIDLVLAIMEHLTKKHPGLKCHSRQVNAIKDAADLIVEAYAKPIVVASPGMGIYNWLRSDDTGLSSKAMVRHLSQGKVAVDLAPHWCQSHPLDPADFGRCVRMLEAAPEYRPLVPRMATLSPTWAAYAARWDEMEAMYREELPTGKAPRLYALMQEIQDGVRVEGAGK